VLAEEEPPPPRAHRPDLSPELDWITAKAMSKERERRYPSVVALSEDLERFLRHEPVSAGPPGRLYPVRKFVRRHRTAVAAAAVVLLAIVAGLVGTTLGLLRARRAEALSREAEIVAREAEAAATESAALAHDERTKALAEARRARAATDFLVDVLSSPHPAEQGRDVRVLDVLERAGSSYEERFADDPRIRARVSGALGAVYQGLGITEEAESRHREAVALLREMHPGGHADLALELRRLGLVLMKAGKLREADAVLREGLEIERGLGGGVGLHRAQAQMGRLLLARSDPQGAEQLLRDAVEGLEASIGSDARETLLAVNSLAGVLHEAARLDEARELYERALAGLIEHLGDEHPDVVRVRFNLAMLAFGRGEAEEAIESFRGVLEAYERLLGPEHPDTLLAYSNLGGMLQIGGRRDEAAPLYAEAIERARHALPPDHPVTVTMSVNLAMLAKEAGDLDEAEDMLSWVHDVRRSNLGDGNFSTLRTLFDLAQIAWDRGDRDLALERTVEGLELSRSELGDDHYFVYRYQLMYGGFLVDLERYSEAEELLLECVDLHARAQGSPTPLVPPDAALERLYELRD